LSRKLELEFPPAGRGAVFRWKGFPAVLFRVATLLCAVLEVLFAEGRRGVFVAAEGETLDENMACSAAEDAIRRRALPLLEED